MASVTDLTFHPPPPPCGSAYENKEIEILFNFSFYLWLDFEFQALFNQCSFKTSHSHQCSLLMVKCQHALDHRKSKRVPEKHLLLLYWLCQSPWLCESQQTMENSSRDGNPDHLICLLRNLYACQNMEQQTGYKLGKEYIKAVYCHPAYLTYMQSTSCEMLGWMKHKLESRLLGEISITSDMQMTPLLWQKAKKN